MWERSRVGATVCVVDIFFGYFFIMSAIIAQPVCSCNDASMARLPLPVRWTLWLIGVCFCAILLYVGNAYRNLQLQSEAAERVRAEKQPVFQARNLQPIKLPFGLVPHAAT